MDETQKSKNYSSKKAASSKRKAASSAKMNDSSDKIDSIHLLIKIKSYQII